MLRILVVEDDDSIRQLLMDSLAQRSTAEVDGARDGVEALHQVTTRRYSVVILDLMMPYMSGVDFLESLRMMASDPSLKHLDATPAIIVLTSAPQEVVATAQLEERFPSLVCGVLRKPVDLDALLASIRATDSS
jgi:DNA-binding response OmpR family regulator